MRKITSNISQAKLQLEDALGNKMGVVSILKECMGADYVDILCYNEKKKCLIDKLNLEKIPIRFLEKDAKSMLSEAYKNRVPYHSTHLSYEKKYNIAIDNPYRLDISAQLVMPVFKENHFMGIIRFSKIKHTFSLAMVEKIKQLKISLINIFSQDLDTKVAYLNENFFSIDAEEVYFRLDKILRESEKLLSNTYNPEVIKLIKKIDDNIQNIYNYIQLSTAKIKEVECSAKNIHILIADDVHMNVKILHAMLSKECQNVKFSFAYDGIEALEIIEKEIVNNTPINILFLDHHMPGKLGLEVAQSIRKEDKLKHDKITIVSITNDPNAIKEHKNIFDHHISKPFSKTSISFVIHKIKENHGL